MKKHLFLLFLLSPITLITYAQLTVQVIGSNDVCAPNNVTAAVVNPQPGYSYVWFVGSYDCTVNGGMGGATTYGISDIIQIYGTGEFFCMGTPPVGPPEISNPLLVRVLPGSLGSLYTPILYSGGLNCVSSAELCVPRVFFGPWASTSIQWFKNNLPISGATSGSYTATTTGYYKYKINNACSFTTLSDSVLVTISFNATITPSGPTTFCNGSSVVLSANPTGTGYTYLWKKGNVPISGATNSNYTATNFGIYNVVINSATCSSTSSGIFVDNYDAPTATISPSGSLSICSGSTQLLSANTGLGLSYQWKLNGNNISGATNSTYSANTAGSYTVAITNSFSCSTTSAATTITLGTGATASITGTTTFCAGAANYLTANTGTGISYQWYRNNILQPGATTNTFNANSNGTYYVVETSSCGTATSNSIVVTQINNPNATVSYSTPLSFCTPGNVVLTSSTFSGINYQWQKNSVDIAGATLQNYTATSNGSYKVKQTANGCYKTSAAVTTTTATSVSAAITANGPVTFCTGGSVVLSVSNAVPGYGYQWKKNNVNIINATQSSYTATAAGSYTCTVTASCGTAASNAIVVSTGGITASVTPSGTVTICTGATALLSANTGSGYAFQWKKNGTNITGATTSTYNATTAGAYTVAITSPCGNATSAATTVNIANVTASINPTGNISVCSGAASNYTANAGYNYSYQWRRNGVALTGATNQTYSNNTAGSYTVVVTQGGVCSATSGATVLTEINNPVPTITAQGPTTFCAGQSVVLAANTYAGVSYQWQKNSIDIANGTNQNYTATTQGTYRVKQTANGCLKTSGTIAVTVNCRVAGEGFGEEHAGHSDIKVIPNPFTDEIAVSGWEFTTGDRLQILNILGEIVLNETIRSSTSNHKLQTSNLPAGVYFLQLTTSTEKKTVKVVKQ